jgi:hypothetical protein
LITGSWYGHVKRISVDSRQFDKDLGKVCGGRSVIMKITADGEKLIVGDSKGGLRLISSRDGEEIKDFGQVHDNWINAIMITAD